MVNRADLNAALKTVVPNVYYQPSANTNIRYPAITYTRNDTLQDHGSNNVHMRFVGYQLLIMDVKPTDPIVDKVLNELPYTTFQNGYISNGVYHTAIQIYTQYLTEDITNA